MHKYLGSIKRLISLCVKQYGSGAEVRNPRHFGPARLQWRQATRGQNCSQTINRIAIGVASVQLLTELQGEKGLPARTRLDMGTPARRAKRRLSVAGPPARRAAARFA